ncbi:MAG: aminotransferase class I/II-fold pyridoxal phosphate-dependent enzyme, partial [Chitinophagaceae bacterium]
TNNLNMKTETDNLKSLHLLARNQKLADRLGSFKSMMSALQITYKRTVLSAADREVSVKDPFTGVFRNMLMFASNNYLGLATHPHVKQRTKKAIDKFGCGIGGPPLLNGYVQLIKELEERLAAFKSQEAAIVFSSGFLANLAVVSALAEHNDVIIYDELSHASFYDGIRLTKAKAIPFVHNNMRQLERLVQENTATSKGTVFICTEGVYSMDGDIAPLDKISRISKGANAVLVVDDAHGTGVLGENGGGTASHLQCDNDVDITMGTFSKVFATCGGFITASTDLIEYLRYHARPYIFSASIPPPVAATVLAGLEVIESEPWLRRQLFNNVDYAIEKLTLFEFYAPPQAAIITLKLPENMDIRNAAYLFHQKNIFINPVEYPAVPANKQRFRISIMATHTKEDIDTLATAAEEIWDDRFSYSD